MRTAFWVPSWRRERPRPQASSRTESLAYNFICVTTGRVLQSVATGFFLSASFCFSAHTCDAGDPRCLHVTKWPLAPYTGGVTEQAVGCFLTATPVLRRVEMPSTTYKGDHEPGSTSIKVQLDVSPRHLPLRQASKLSLPLCCRGPRETRTERRKRGQLLLRGLNCC